MKLSRIGRLLLFAGGTASLAAPQLRADAIETDSFRFKSGGRPIDVDVFRSHGRRARGVVILLHGVGGMLGDGAFLRRVARSLAEAGLSACIVHYFDRTGQLWTSRAGINRGVGQWKEAIRDSVDVLSGHFSDARLGILGYSLGGFVAIAIANEHPAVEAVACFSGGLADNARNPRRIPPLLIVHGEHDPVVPIVRAEALADAATALGTPLRFVRVAGQKHVFGRPAERDAVDHAVAFFGKWLDSAESGTR